jgi:hypothetical protein
MRIRDPHILKFFDSDPGSDMQDPASEIRDGKIRIRDGKNTDPGWKKYGSGIRDGKNSDPGSGINNPDPQHRCLV